MRDRALLGLMALLAGMGVLVDFTSLLLSMLADMLLMGAAFGCGYLIWSHQRRRIAGLEARLALAERTP